MTIPLLREYISAVRNRSSVEIKPASKRKADLIAAIKAHLDLQEANIESGISRETERNTTTTTTINNNNGGTGDMLSMFSYVPPPPPTDLSGQISEHGVRYYVRSDGTPLVVCIIELSIERSAERLGAARVARLHELADRLCKDRYDYAAWAELRRDFTEADTGIEPGRLSNIVTELGCIRADEYDGDSDDDYGNGSTSSVCLCHLRPQPAMHKHLPP